MVRHFIRDDDLSSDEQAEVLELASLLKKNRYAEQPFAGPQTVALLFDKTSTRTRVSFSVGVSDLGGVPLVLDSQSTQLSKKESVADTTRVLERQVAQIVWRTYEQSNLESMSSVSSVPVINSLSDDFHPCQLLADLQTVREHFGSTVGLKVAYLGDGDNNMSNSYLLAAATAGMSISIAAPEGYQPSADLVELARKKLHPGQVIEIGQDPVAAVTAAHVVTTDTWVSMGMEQDQKTRVKDLEGFRVNRELMAHADSESVFLHCLPAYRGQEVDAEVIDGKQSLVWEQAENRLHAQKALMTFLARHRDG